MLDRHRHVGEASPHQFRIQVVQIEAALAGRDVHPLDHNVAVEMSRILRPPDQDPCLVGGRGAGQDAPPPVAWFGLAVNAVAFPAAEKLLLDVAVGRQLQGIRTERFDDASAGNRARKGGGGLVGRVCAGGSRRRCAEGPAACAYRTRLAISPVSPVSFVSSAHSRCPSLPTSRDVPGSLVPRDPSLPARPYMRQVVQLRPPFGEGHRGHLRE